MNKLLTVVIPAYNVEQYLDNCISSFLDDEINDKIEILVVNDGSKDRTADIALEYQKKYPETVRLITKKNGGHGSTINTGKKYAIGKYFKVVDGDDWVDTNNFIKFVNLLASSTSDVILTPFERINNENQVKKLITTDKIIPKRQYIFEEVIDKLGDFYQIHSTTFKTSIIKRITAITENCFYVDQQYITFPIGYVKTLEMLDLVVYKYRVENENQSVSLKNYQKNIKMLEKVALSIVSYVDSIELSTNKKNFCIKRAAGITQKVTHVCLSMKERRSSKIELFSFLDKIKKSNVEVYNDIPGLEFQLLKSSNGLLYSPINIVGRLKRKIL